MNQTLIIVTAGLFSILPTSTVGQTSPIKIHGTEMDQTFGYSLAAVGDVNGDSYPDLLVGARYANGPAGTWAGQAFLYFGGTTIDTVADLVFNGQFAYQTFANSVASAGDVNKDGYPDLVIGGYNDFSGPARAYVYYGGPSIDTTADVILTSPQSGSLFGFSVSGAGDMNGDGYDDVVVGAYSSDAATTDGGRIYIYFGGSPMDSTADVIFSGVNFTGQLGRSVSAAGDINGDGYDDIIVGEPGNDLEGQNRGRALVFRGGSTVSSLPYYTYFAAANNDNFGQLVRGVGSVNGDAYDDVLVYAVENSNRGRVALHFGGSSLDASIDRTFVGEGPSNNFGFGLAAGDVNKDGISDIAIGTYAAGATGTLPGRVSIYYGGTAMDTTADRVFNSDTWGTFFGLAIAIPGDMNKDGTVEVAIGAYGVNTPVTRGAGCVYIYSVGGAVDVAREDHHGMRSPTGFALDQNYPNPFNPQTMIDFAIEKPAVTMLRVYDQLGREVATLLNEQKEPGRYRVAFDGSTLPSGVYFCRMQAGTFAATRRMLLLR